MFTPQRRSPDREPRLPRAVRVLGPTLAVVLGMGLGIGPVAAARPDRSAASTAAAASPQSVKTEVAAAKAALASAVASFGAHNYPAAKQQLAALRSHSNAAHVDATALIGKPPTDPESDDPPGPPAVLSVVRLDRSINAGVVPLFNKLAGRPKVVLALRVALGSSQYRRDVMLDKVIALPPEGKGADYADDMADTLGMFAKDVQTINTALTTYTLTASSKTGLTNALARAKATKAKVNRAWGGGERVVAGT